MSHLNQAERGNGKEVKRVRLQSKSQILFFGRAEVSEIMKGKDSLSVHGVANPCHRVA